MSTDSEYKRYKAQHRCAACGTPLLPEYTKVTCPECIAKAKAHRDANKERYAQTRRNLLQYRREHGLCLKCGKAKDSASQYYSECKACRIKKAEYQRNKLIRQNGERVNVVWCKYCKHRATCPVVWSCEDNFFCRNGEKETAK